MNKEYENYLLSEKYRVFSLHRDEIVRMLEGEKNRICVTHDPVELKTMQRYAKKNIDRLVELNIQRLRDSGLYKKA